MTKSCERPGCSEPGVVASSFERSTLTVVLSHYVGEVEEGSFNVMCTKHADMLTVPRGWTIDDRREDPPRLFAAPERKPVKRDQTSSISRRRKSRSGQSPKLFDQIALVTKLESPPPPVEEPAVEVEEPTPVVVDEPVADVEKSGPVVDQDATKAWKPQFDRTDDLGGVLRPKGKLLSRAFGLDETVSQPRPEPTDRLEREPFNEHDIP